MSRDRISTSEREHMIGKRLLTAIKLVLADLAALERPAVAASLAGLLVPVVVAVAGVPVSAAEVAGWLVLAGGVAALLQKLASGKAG